jgi:polyphosphate kinase 2 (PPK2 family)
MLEHLDLSLSLSNPAFQYIRNLQRKRLFELEEMVFETKLPMIIVLEGWDAAGKGAVIRELTRRLDPRGFKVYQTQAPRTLEKKMPWLWRFWMQIPRRGQIAIFDRSWYGRVQIERVEGLIPIPDWIRAYEEINNFERTLAADRVVFVKFWLQITEEDQLRRFIEISNDPMEAWQISAEDWERHRKYKEYLAAVKDMLENTHTEHAPWTVIPATDLNYCIFQVYGALIHAMERALGAEETVWPSLAQLEAEGAAADEGSGTEKAEKKEKKEKKGAKAKKAAKKTPKAPKDKPIKPSKNGADEKKADKNAKKKAKKDN